MRFLLIPGGSATSPFTGLNGQTITGAANGAWAITATGTAQNITLTPSGTGVTNLIGNNVSPLLLTKGTGAGGIVFSFNGSAYLSSILTSESGAAANCYMDLGVATGNNTTTQQVLRLVGNGRALVGTTDDSGAVLQVGTNTTNSTGGMVFGTDSFLFRSAARVLTLGAALGSTFRLRDTTNGTNLEAIVNGNTSIKFATSGFSGGVVFTLGTEHNGPLVLETNSTAAVTISAAGLVTNAVDTFLHRTSVAMANGASASVGTLTNAPAVGNPTKWISIDDNGTTRYVPAW